MTWAKGRDGLPSATMRARRGESNSRGRQGRLLLPVERKAAKQGQEEGRARQGSRENSWEAGTSHGLWASSWDSEWLPTGPIWRQHGGAGDKQGASDHMRKDTSSELLKSRKVRPT